MKFTETFNQAVKFKNIKEIIYNSVKLYPNNNAFIIKKDIKKAEYKYVTYKQFLENINCFGTALLDLGLKDNRIAICGINSYEWALTYTTNLLGNMVSIPLDKGLMIGELEDSLIRSKADCVVFDAKHADMFKQIKENGKTIIKEYICMNESDEFKTIEGLIEKGKNLRKLGKKDYENIEINNEDMKILLFTSGTTSASKAVMLSQKNIAENIYSMQLVEKFYPTDVNLALLPFHHVFGSTGLLVMLASGICNCFPDGLRYIAQNMKEYKVSVYIGVPQLIEAMYKKILAEVEKKGKLDTVKKGIKISNFLLKFHIDIRRKLFKQIIDAVGGNLRFIVNGAAALDKDVSKGFNDFGIRTVQGYGLSETAPVLCAENDKYLKPGSIGKPMPNVEIEIYNPDEDGIGELRAKGPNIFLGYYENEEATKEVLKDGWFYTGDLGYIDKDEFVFLTGRKKNMIVLKNGKKVFPEEFEILINDLDEVKECMVFGLPKENDDVLLSVKVQYDKEYMQKTYPNKSIEEYEKIIWDKIKIINQTVPKYKYIKNMILTDEDFIMTSTAKIKRYEEMKRILKNKSGK